MSIDAAKIVATCRESFNKGCTRSYEQRKQLLESMLNFIKDHQQDMIDAMTKDLRKPRSEAMGMEISFAENEVIHALNHLKEWMKDEKTSKPMAMVGKDVYIKSEPVGVMLIIGAWNYPVQLILHPLIGAIMAGNTAVMKPSELSPATAAVFEKFLPKYLDKDCYTLVNGGIPETTALLAQRFDHILYTGSSPVAKIVMAAAAKHLTPVTLELGGKSPAFVDKDCNMYTVARRIAWGRFINSGQTCIAPDYVLLERETRDKFVEALKDAVKEFYGENPQDSKDFGRIINERHFKRVVSLLDSGKCVMGGQTDEKEKYVAPTVLVDVKPDDPVMTDEVFGPVLPIMTVSDVDEAVNFINSREKPLAMYVFSNKKQVVDSILNRTSSGGFTANDVLMHAAVDTLPFGGIGNSGMGGYHGKHSFDRFSHKRAVVIGDQSLESLLAVRYPPYTESKEGWLLWLMKKSRNRSRCTVM
ncbi:aldehyde dehydrogenase, dimeric NADP-preferring-like isoform X2 [Antedon mediterranea]|uniref:aldehyde dehydrogenase, dimeric NADP-preferring-like isoform X2 n=2 Tax=Antedon mediterranea TaxID=105859 RepID=UPI003AF53124